MKGTANAIWANVAGTKEGERPSEGLQYDWAVTALSAWLVGGLYLDVWAHNHDAGVESFFTPWHAVFYSGFLAVAAYLLGTWVKNIGRGYSWKRAVPRGYTLSLLGVAIFAAGGLFDMLWHLAFGVEVSVEALLSPSHLLLALGIVLIVSGPFRAAWKRTAGTPTGLVALLPMLLSITFVLSVFAGLTEYAHPFVDLWAAQRPEGARQLPILNELYVMNADGSSQIRLTLEPEQQHSNPAWSPDGSRIVFANGAAEIYVISLDGRSQTRLTNSQGGGWKPAWSPDGNKIALSTERDGNVEVYVMNADGSEQLNLTRNGASDLWGDWSPDGKKIAFTSDRDGNDEIYVMYSDGGEVTRLTNDAAADGLPAWSPDGSEIAFTSDRDG